MSAPGQESSGYPKPEFPPQQHEHPGEEAAMTPKPDYGYDSYKGHGRLYDKVALITGGDSGIGRAAALAFSREGADIAFTHLADEADDAQEAERVLLDSGRGVLRIEGDISQEDFCKELVRQTVARFGRIDTVVNNAAYQMSFDDLDSLPTELLRHTFETNLYPMFWITREALPAMRSGSTIINVTSVQATDPSPSLLPYASSKGAISTFTQGLAKQLADKGIRVNAVAPGPVWTPLIPASLDKETVRHFGEGNLLGRPAQPAELAPTFVYLASEDSSFIDGEIINVNGGR